MTAPLDAKFAGSSRNLEERPASRLPEFAFIGRSNVGKSSLINCLCNHAGLARTSAKPGKTVLINHFLVDGKWYLVDLPGYGYARLGKEGRQQLSDMINSYVTGSQEMVVLFVLLDSRHEIQKIDLEFMMMLGREGIPFAIVYTKCDKSGVNALAERIEKNNATLLEYWEELPPVFRSSSETGLGRDEILNYINITLNSIKK